MIHNIACLHNKLFGMIECALKGWLPGLLARLVFAAVLLVYFLNSAARKLGEGVAGFFSVSDSAYFQILPPVIERYNYDATQVPFFPWDIIVYLGTYSEFVLPVLIVVGLFTRIAALGMIGFVCVQSYVDIAFHNVDAATIGGWFDHLSNAAIMDQRALWVFLLAYLVIHGAGAVSLDSVFSKIRARRSQTK